MINRYTVHLYIVCFAALCAACNTNNKPCGRLIIETDDGKYMLADSNGVSIDNNRYDDLYRSGELLFGGNNSRYCLLDCYGNRLTEMKYEQMSSTTANCVVAVERGRYVVLNSDGTPVSSKHYDSYLNCFNQMAIVGVGERYGVINARGEELIDTRYDQIRYFTDNYALARREGMIYLIVNNYGIVTSTKGNIDLDGDKAEELFEQLKWSAEQIIESRRSYWAAVLEQYNTIVNKCIEMEQTDRQSTFLREKLWDEIGTLRGELTERLRSAQGQPDRQQTTQFFEITNRYYSTVDR